MSLRKDFPKRTINSLYDVHFEIRVIHGPYTIRQFFLSVTIIGKKDYRLPLICYSYTNINI